MESKMRNKTHISIIIVNYKTADMVTAAVDSIVAHTAMIDYEIIVVDNCSGEQEINLLRRDTRYRLIALDKNLGFGGANNIGAAEAQSDYLFFLNPDTVLRNNAILYLYNYMQCHPECGIAGGNLYDVDGYPCHSFHRMLPSIGSEMDFATKQIYRRLRYGRSTQFNYTKTPLRVAMITGADLMIRKSLYDEIKGFDERFFMYCEDADLCQRVLALGYEIVSIPEAEITHLEGRSFTISEQRQRNILEGRKRYFEKHYTAGYCRLADLLNILTLTLAAPLNATYRQRLTIYRQML